VATVKAQSVSGVGDVLVDAQGRTLYTPDQESSGHVLCTGACTKVWLPVTVPTGSSPMADSDVSAKLGTVSRTDGTTQVTAAGRPLYRFDFDNAAGQATGDGVSDAFGGQHFLWHVLTPAGDVSAAQPSPSDSGGSYSYSY
jgi:predicted lipoprotein with Yx(FWY)xxD motif